MLCGLRTELDLSNVETQRANFSFGIFVVVDGGVAICAFWWAPYFCLGSFRQRCGLTRKGWDRYLEVPKQESGLTIDLTEDIPYLTY